MESKTILWIIPASGGLGDCTFYALISKNGEIPNGICVPDAELVINKEVDFEYIRRVANERNRFAKSATRFPYFIYKNKENFTLLTPEI